MIYAQVSRKVCHKFSFNFNSILLLLIDYNVHTGEVYAIGGYNGVKTVDVVEKYNPEEGTWKEVSPLVFGRSVPGIAVAYLWPVQSTMRTFWEGESQL